MAFRETNNQIVARDKLVQNLEDDGFLKCKLAAPSTASGRKWHGASMLEKVGRWRRIGMMCMLV